MKPRCETCRAFYVLTNECRRHAPVMVPVPQPGGGLASAGLYPATRQDGGCAEHIVDDSPVLQ